MRLVRALGFIIVALALAPASVHAAPVLPVGDQVIENGTFTLTEPIVMGPGSTLTIRNATVFLDFPNHCPIKGSAGYCQPQIMSVGGRVIILDSTIDTTLWNPADLSSGYVITAISGSLHIERSTIRHARSVGAQGQAQHPSVVRDSTFVDGLSGPNFIRGQVVEIVRNRLEKLMFGVRVTDGDGIIANNYFTGIMQPSGTGELFGRAIDVQMTLVGDKALSTMTSIENNVVEDSHQALLNLNGYPNVIRNNIFRRNQIGATLGVAVGDTTVHNDPPVFERNVLEDNVSAVVAYTSGGSQEPVEVTVAMRQNSIVGTTCTAVETLATPPTVTVVADATQNWWGGGPPLDNGEDCPATKGNVVVDPWLTAPPF